MYYPLSRNSEMVNVYKVEGTLTFASYDDEDNQTLHTYIFKEDEFLSQSVDDKYGKIELDEQFMENMMKEYPELEGMEWVDGDLYYTFLRRESLY